MRPIELIGLLVVIGLLFGLAVVTFDGLQGTQTVDSLAYNVTKGITEDTAGYSGMYEPLVWIVIVVLIFVFMGVLLYAVKSNF